MSSRRGGNLSDSDNSEVGVRYNCKKCPGRFEFTSKAEWAAHKKAVHPKDKARRQAQEEEEEERSIIAGSTASKRSKRRSPRDTREDPQEASTSEVEESEVASNVSESTLDMSAEPDPEPVTGKRGKPGPKSTKSPRGGKRPAAISTPANQSRSPVQTSTRGGRGKIGPKSVVRGRGRVPDWVDSDIFTKNIHLQLISCLGIRFPGG